MPRKKNVFGVKVDGQIAKQAAAGDTAETISKALRASGVKGASPATVGRRMRELGGADASRRVRSSAALRAAYAEAAADDEPLPDAIPEGTDLAQIERWLERAEKMGKVAAKKGDLPGIGQMGRLTRMLLEAKIRATPPEKPDPSADPEMLKLAQQVETRLLKYVDDIVAGGEQ